MQIEQIEQKGFFQKAKISGGQEHAAIDREWEKQVKKADVVTGSVPMTQTVTYAKPEQEQESVSQEIQNSVAGKDAVQMKNEMVVGANRSSSEHVRAIEEDGFSLPDTDIIPIVLRCGARNRSCSGNIFLTFSVRLRITVS